jgi:hypothetical protein
VVPEPYNSFFMGLYTLSKGNLKVQSISEISETLGFSHEFILLSIVAMLKRDKDLIRFTISKFSDGVCNQMTN